MSENLKRGRQAVMACPDIMYVCTICAEPGNNPEGCGYYDRDMVRQVPSGEWVCECCYDEMRREDWPDWRSLPQSPEVAPTTPPEEGKR